MKTAFLSLGSNLGDRTANLRQALAAMEAAGVHAIKQSSVYETEPQDLRNQPWFLNLVVQVQTTLFPLQLLHLLQKIELALGRRRAQAKGPRSIDIDILLFSRFVVESAELEVPHPRMHLRRFVLEPLAEIAPEVRHPVLRKTAEELLAGLSGQKVAKTDIAW
ncbi:MAG TPA: 2-amino-4-hydroxy-6-hydroxymethyldihydropteridine diphosphokinase [Bryobacteraceae bacterium]|nr:2-amino-4-hydroxy-6-hydroxymethyldihydropteridine diphosphokinase [Bryobacteraceae bacterium]